MLYAKRITIWSQKKSEACGKRSDVAGGVMQKASSVESK